MTAKAKYTLIPVRPETRERLKRFGMKGDSYDRIINRLMLERTKELVLTRKHLTLDEVERVMESDEGIPLRELRSRLGI